MFDIGDRVTILRDGKFAKTSPMGEIDHDGLIASMVGRKIEKLYPHKPDRQLGEPRLTVKGLVPAGSEAAIDLTVRAGEIVGIAGLLGSGRSELLRAMFGADPPEAGEVEVDGKRMPLGSPRKAVQAGLGLLTEDRKTLGLLLELSIRENASLAHLDEISRFWVVDKKKERNLVDHYLGGLKLRAGSWEQPVSSLSGGNQQKVLLARVLMNAPKILLLDEPTKGVDVGTKQEIYRLIVQLADEGMAIVMVSSEIPELLGLCDRCLVLAGGTIVDEFERDEGSEERVIEATTLMEAA
jgi:rhamnose transport system ATP-binding protein